MNTLTPHYEEDVIYSLKAGDTACDLGLDPAAARVTLCLTYAVFSIDSELYNVIAKALARSRSC